MNLKTLALLTLALSTFSSISYASSGCSLYISAEKSNATDAQIELAHGALDKKGYIIVQREEDAELLLEISIEFPGGTTKDSFLTMTGKKPRYRYFYADDLLLRVPLWIATLSMSAYLEPTGDYAFKRSLKKIPTCADLVL